MGWPLSQDYNEAIQAPASCLLDESLRQSRPTLNALGIPLPCSGNFADVYELTCPDGTRWALKCFTRAVPDLHQRYAALSQHLAAAALPFTVEFTFLPQGIRVRGSCYPVLKMRWVEGLLLNEFVREALEKPSALESLWQIWLRLGQRLREARMAHGDLQHGNILLVAGRKQSSLAVKLIDYDGLWVPALAHRPSGEVGHANYQHPQRLRRGGYGPDMDRFSLLLIATALRAVAVAGRPLWQNHDNGDNLLFRAEDLAAPQQSALFGQLSALSDPLLQRLVRALRQACAAPLEQVPLLEEVLEENRPAVVHRTELTMPPVPSTAVMVEEDFVQAEIEHQRALRRQRHRRGVSRERGPVPVWVWGAAAGALLAIGLATAVAWTVLRARTPTAAMTERAMVRTAPQTALVQQPPPPPTTPPATKSSGTPGFVQPPPEPALQSAAELPARPGLFRVVGNDSNLLALSAEASPTWLLYSAQRQAVLRRFDQPAGAITDLAATPDGRLALTAGDDGTARVWDTTTGQATAVLHGDGRRIDAIALMADGSQAATAHGADVVLWDVAQHAPMGGFRSSGEVKALAFAPNGLFLACGLITGADNRGTFLLYQVGATSPLHRFEADHLGTTLALAFSPDSKLLAAGGTGPRGYLLDRATNVLTPNESRLSGPVEALVFSPNGRNVLLLGRHGLALWGTNPARYLTTHLRPPNCTVAAGFVTDDFHVRVFYLDGPGQPINSIILNYSRPQASPPLAQRAGRLPVPSDKELAAARAHLRLLYPDVAIMNLEPPQEAQLRSKLLQMALGRSDPDPTMHYVAYLELYDRSMRQGQFHNGLQIITLLNHRFAVDMLQLQCTFVEKVASIVRDLEAADMVEEALRLADLAAGLEDYDKAQRFVHAASQALPAVRRAQQRLAPLRREGNSAQQLSRATDRARRDLDVVQAEYIKIAPARKALAANASDPEANLAVGRFRCFIRDAWEEGLPLLARGADPQLRSLTQSDLAAAEDANARKALADAWYEQANKATGTDRDACRRRAFYWYQDALPDLRAPVVAKERIAELQRQLPLLRDPWHALNLVGSARIGDRVHIPKRKRITTRQCYRGGVDLTVVARTEKNNIRLNIGDGGEVIFNWEGTGGGIRIHAPSGTGQYPGPYQGAVPTMLTPQEWHTLRWRQTPTRIEVWVDGALVFEKSGHYDMSLPRPVGVRSHFDSAIDVQSVRVRPVRQE